MNVDLLDNRKKQLNIHSRVEDIAQKLDCPDVFEKHFRYEADRRLLQATYLIRCKIFSSEKKYTLKIKMSHSDEIMSHIFNEIEEGRRRGLIG